MPKSTTSTIRNNTGVKVTKQNLDDVLAGVLALAASEVLVGFPADKTDRQPDPTEAPEKEPMTNAALGFIHDNGAPEVNIPARPFMTPGIKRAQEKIEAYLTGAMKAAMRGNVVAAEGQMHAAGLAAKVSIQNVITEGIDPPLSDRTLRARAKRSKQWAYIVGLEQKSRAAGNEPSTDLIKPLIETGQMRNAINYVIRRRSQRPRR